MLIVPSQVTRLSCPEARFGDPLYILTDQCASIRSGNNFITIKGIGNASGASRYEWEKEIPVEEVNELLKICEPGVIDKTRYHVVAGPHTYEVDEFYGENQGLTVAEVELSSEEEDFAKPDWLGEEVTGDVKYYNSMLMKNPFTKW